jgi:signal transduction histidine kinase
MSRRLLLGYLALTIAVLAVLEVPLGVTYAHNERQDLEGKVERDAVTVASLSEGTLEGRGETSPASLRTIALRYQADTGGRVVVVDKRGDAVVDTRALPGDRSFASRPEIAAALAGKVASGVRHSTTLGVDLLYVAVPIASSGRIMGAARITYPTSAVDRRVRRYWLTLAAIAGIVLAGVTLVGLGLARGVVRPLRRVEEVAAEIGAGRLDARAPEDGPPEVRRLAHELNETAAKLEQLLESQQAFVADASHELRTPLTALRLRLENMDPAATGPALAEVERLGRLVEALLSLARADAATGGTEAVGVDAVLADRLAERTGVIRSGERGLHVRSTADRLGQMIDNLVANALAVSDTVVVSASSEEGWVELHVVDDGPGLTAEERERAFDRFWRGRTAGPGSGLGLAIVRRLARVDGGDAELRAAPGGGIDATVRLRRSQPDPSTGKISSDVVTTTVG